jgi:iron complex transport system permease protein
MGGLKKRSSKTVFILNTLTFLVLLITIAYLSINTGAVPASPFVLRYRFYRVLEAILAGLILGASGAYLQASLRNPLVDHYILGIGSGALFSVYTTILLVGVNMYLVPGAAILGGLGALALTILVAEKMGGSDVAYVLSGLGVNSLFSGASMLLSYLILTVQPYALFILAGSLITASPRLLPQLLASALLVYAAYPPLAKPLNTLLLGDTYSLQLGYSPRNTRRAATIVAGISSSLVVACFGLIGFLGLVSPHIARFLSKTSDNRIIIPLASLVSGLLLLLTDDLSRIYLVELTGEIPAGAIASLFGAPFFLFLILLRFKGTMK